MHSAGQLNSRRTEASSSSHFPHLSLQAKSGPKGRPSPSPHQHPAEHGRGAEHMLIGWPPTGLTGDGLDPGLELFAPDVTTGGAGGGGSHGGEWRRTRRALACEGKGRAERALRQPLRRRPSLEKAAAISSGFEGSVPGTPPIAAPIQRLSATVLRRSLTTLRPDPCRASSGFGPAAAPGLCVWGGECHRWLQYSAGKSTVVIGPSLSPRRSSVMIQTLPCSLVA
jgi:hypothetical protein